MTKVLTVRLDDEVHTRVKLRAVSEGVAMEALAREWFSAYADRRAVNGGLAAGEHGGTEITGAEEVPHEPVASVPARAPSAPAASPAKRCSREARHHINHGGNPCKECGYPK